MSGEQRKELATRTVTGVRASSATSKKLANMPLSVLLPKLGDVRDVAVYADEIEARLSELQSLNAASTGGEVDPELRRRRTLEESMLNQAMQWLSIQSNRE